MKRESARSSRLPVLAVALTLLGTALLYALQVPPAPTSWVNDYAGLLPGEEREKLNAKLAACEKASGSQIVFAIFSSLQGESLEDFSMRLAEQWKLGKKGRDNGVLLTLFMKERRVRIEVGYGLEDKITDAVSGRIIREMAGYFRQNDYSGGLSLAADRLIALAGGAVAEPEPSSPKPGQFPWVLAILVIMILMRAVIPRKATTGFRIDSRGRRLNHIPWWLPLVMGSSTRRRDSDRRGGNWDSSSGGFSGGFGGGFGGGSGGGGFSGGGGGSFGGGGSSGSW